MDSAIAVALSWSLNPPSAMSVPSTAARAQPPFSSLPAALEKGVGLQSPRRRYRVRTLAPHRKEKKLTSGGRRGMWSTIKTTTTATRIVRPRRQHPRSGKKKATGRRTYGCSMTVKCTTGSHGSTSRVGAPKCGAICSSRHLSND
jgi:hypothetical protein